MEQEPQWVTLNPWWWDYDTCWSPHIEERLSKGVKLRVEGSTVSLDPQLLPLPANLVYSYIQYMFDDPDWMDYPAPMSAQTPKVFSMIPPWSLANSQLRGLYHTVRGTQQGEFWGNPHGTDEKSRLHLFVGDFFVSVEDPPLPQRGSLSLWDRVLK